MPDTPAPAALPGLPVPGDATQRGAPTGDLLQVTVIRDPEDAPATQARLRRLNDPDAGILVLNSMPYVASPRDLTYSVLDALGKVLPPRSSAGLPTTAWPTAVSWTLGYRLHAIVINRAHTMPASLHEAIRELTAPAPPYRPRLYLIDASASKHHTVIDRFTAPDCHLTVGGSGLLNTIHRRQHTPDPWRSRLDIPGDLPADSFLTFRAACARNLSDQVMTRVDELYIRALHDARQWVHDVRAEQLTSNEAIVATLALPLSVRLAARMNVASPGECLVRLRAAQAGLLCEGILLHHQPHPRGHDHGLGHRLAPTTVTVINRSTSTQEAAAAILYLLFPFGSRHHTDRWHPDELPLDDVEPSGSHARIAGVRVPVPPHARPALRAHHHFRHKQGARHGTTGYFHSGKRRPDVRTLATRGLAGTSHHPAWRSEEDRHLAEHDHNTLWMWQRRLVLRNLIRPSTGLDLSLPRWT
ncbi:hypothetical protein [Nonomuraea zeae]|uniref:Uncharacterized protein n=1 Tax=Nonomuraea zeae TaxID=1642303 RepID=A0A5S4G108_9ACTN|nr:hypothetical protein [Nonomuraea zeae]TMR26727.1 hypothetical protein ETD85_41635 [Nonomuraea zeae]